MARATIRDVAKEAGVSIKTVSRVTNGDRDVAPPTAARVREAIAVLGYQPNPLARSLRTGRDEAIGLVVETLADPFFAAVSDAVEAAAREAGLFLVISGAGRTAEEERAVVMGLLHRSVQGLLIVPCKLDYAVERLPIGPGGVPVVFVDRPATLDADTVLVDNVEVARAAVSHLVAHGHRRIAFIGTQIERYTVRRRFEGYEAALGAAGIPSDPELIVSHPDQMSGGAGLGSVLDLADPATAVFTANAVASIAAVRDLHQRGRTDVAMVSFDDFPVADSLTPAISVADQDPVIMGRHAFEALKARIEGDTTPPRQILVPMHFVPRGSGELAPRPTAQKSARRSSSTSKPVGRSRRLVIPPPKPQENHMSDTPRAGLASVAREDGTMAIVAMDQRNTLRRMLTAVNRSTEDQELREFKVDVVEALSPYASAFLLDPEYGVPAVKEAGVLAPSCAVLIAAEPPDRDVWNGEPRARRDPERTAEWVKSMGGDAVKLLVQLRPDRVHRPGEPDLVAEVVDVVQAVVDDCAQAGVPSIVETLLYPLPDEAPLSERQRADLIVESARILTETKPDLLKLEFPMDAAGCRGVASVATVPWAMLSAGMPLEVFLDAVKLSCDEGGASGFVAGRVYWKEAVGMESPERKKFLATTSRDRLEQALAAMEGRARPWMAAGASASR